MGRGRLGSNGSEGSKSLQGFHNVGFSKKIIISSALLRLLPYPQEPEAHSVAKERFKDSGSSMASGP